MSEEEARRLGHNYIGTEHLLLGLIREGETIGAKVLIGLEVTLGKVEAEVAKILGYSESKMVYYSIVMTEEETKKGMEGETTKEYKKSSVSFKIEFDNVKLNYGKFLSEGQFFFKLFNVIKEAGGNLKIVREALRQAEGEEQ